MRRREFITTLGTAIACPLAARAQQPNKVPRIGVLWHSKNAETHPYFKVVRDGFKAVGYAEGDLIFEDRFYGLNLEKADLFAKELVDLKCDVLIGVTVPAARALQRHTSTIPIVFVWNANPIPSGLVSSFNHPGGNITGVASSNAEIAAKRVELLRDTIPGLSSVAMIWDPFPALQYNNPIEVEDSRTAADRLGLSFASFECGSREGLEEAISRASRFGAAIFGNSNYIFWENTLKRIAELAIARKLAVIGWTDFQPEAGFLMSYGADESVVARSAAPVVKKILEGVDPGNIPVQQPTAFDLVNGGGHRSSNRADDVSTSDTGHRVTIIFAAVHESAVGTKRRNTDFLLWVESGHFTEIPRMTASGTSATKSDGAEEVSSAEVSGRKRAYAVLALLTRS
jgi:putative ABC transport system substrate-binding protein